MIVLIPAYEPNRHLIKLINDLKEECDYNILIVDDGSGQDYRHIFDEAKNLGCIVITHDVNKGKGKALKTGFDYIRRLWSNEGVVCADCDGQHLPKDIVRVAEAIMNHKDNIVLGTRRFVGKVPFRSQFGNSVTRAVFSFASGSKVYDTQTGLRGFSSDMLDWLVNIEGERFEYEMNMLLEAGNNGYGFHQIDIDTVYLEQNKSSHFKPLRDSLKIYLPIFKFSMSSILSGIIDFALLIIMQMITNNLLLSVVGARVCSSIFNYSMNRMYVFSRGSKVPVKDSFFRYFLLVLIVLMANYGLIHTYIKIIGLSVFFAKVFAEITIFIFSFWSQRKFVFRT